MPEDLRARWPGEEQPGLTWMSNPHPGYHLAANVTRPQGTPGVSNVSKGTLPIQLGIHPISAGHRLGRTGQQDGVRRGVGIDRVSRGCWPVPLSS